MDIKLKNYNKIRLSTALVFTLCVIFFSAALTSGVLSIRTLSSADYSSGSIDDYLLRPNYAESEEYQREYERRVYDVLYMLDQFKSEAYIKTGASVNQDRLENELRNFYANTTVMKFL